MKKIIFNADDLGLSALTDSGIIECAKNGVVKSASLMITSPDAKESYMNAILNKISVGLHLDVTTLNNFLEGKVKDALSRNIVLSNKELDQIIEEFQKQLDLYIKMFGVFPDHINHHHPLYFISGFTQKFKEWVIGTMIPTRCFRDLGKTNLKCPNYTGFEFYDKENLTLTKLIEMINKSPDGVTEIMTHPGRLDTDLNSVYIAEREIQLNILTDPKLKRCLFEEGIEITDFTIFKDA